MCTFIYRLVVFTCLSFQTVYISGPVRRLVWDGGRGERDVEKEEERRKRRVKEEEENEKHKDTSNARMEEEKKEQQQQLEKQCWWK